MSPKKDENLKYAGRVIVRDELDPGEAEHVQRVAELGAEAERTRWVWPSNGERSSDRYGPYTPDGEHSYFVDLYRVALARARADQAVQNPILRGQDPGEGALSPALRGDSLAEVRKRLDVAARFYGPDERRDLTSSLGAGGEFLPPQGVPSFIGDEFARSARAQARIPGALRTRPLPESGMKIEVPRLSGGASVGVQASENSTVSETDPTSALASSNVAVVAGQVDMSAQLFDRVRPGFDVVLARDLGAALGAAVDSQLVSGSNSSGQTLGLASVTGRVAISYTDASPSATELLSKIWDGYRQLADPAIGYGVSDPDAYVIVLHPRRHAFLQAAFSTPVEELVPGRLVQSAGVRSGLGAGTNEDEVFMLVRGESFVALDPPTFRVFPEVGSATLTVRVQAVQGVAAMFARQPKSIAHLTGTGFTTPTL